jgi:hypothetical protein
MAAPWSISNSNGGGTLTDTSPFKRIEKGLDALLGRKITGVGFNGKAPMLTFEIEGGVILRVFAEMDEYYPGWDFSAQRSMKRHHYDYREDPPFEP